VTAAQHPSYPNPLIVEAVCEIQFELSEENPWKPSLFGDFYRNVQGEYPEMEPLQGVGVQLQVSPQGLGMRFRHAERPLFLQLEETSLIVNFLAPYPGWERVVRDVMDAWRHAVQVLSPSAVTRIGLRYINRIEQSSSKDRPGDWIKPNDYVAAEVLNSKPGFLSRAEARTTEYDTTLVTLGDQPPDDLSIYGAIIFDIDRITNRVLPAKEQELEQEVTRLHEDVWQVFSSAKSERLEALLQGAEA
jgi:uncharacterized protein (TIGR04255 family)